MQKDKTTSGTKAMIEFLLTHLFISSRENILSKEGSMKKIYIRH